MSRPPTAPATRYALTRYTQARYCLCTHHEAVHEHGCCTAKRGDRKRCDCVKFRSQVGPPDYHKATPCRWKP